MGTLAEKHECSSLLYPCLDHGGPWLKDAQRVLYALTNSNRSAPSSASRALKRTPRVFVFWDLHRDPVQTKEIPTLGDDLPSKRNRRILLAARAQENGEQLRTG
jgi:hypothetical protein